ncbi:hypothetical protein [Photobacterium kishitanii]|uniref:Uncharacterized protein n=1 Tax=Photobacterium kishitanii TaxID=318456 RepID=A0A2T3KLH5_9GAMM|nr:hypothetical protein [Photobacterium kishitanii]PSV00541.1 hypothetical protein C9J27_05245 [Photobacterium kishitanii]
MKISAGSRENSIDAIAMSEEAEHKHLKKIQGVCYEEGEPLFVDELSDDELARLASDHIEIEAMFKSKK